MQLGRTLRVQSENFSAVKLYLEVMFISTIYSLERAHRSDPIFQAEILINSIKYPQWKVEFVLFVVVVVFFICCR